MRSRCQTLFGLMSLLVSTLGLAQVVPNAQTTAPGDALTSALIGNYRPTRLQQVYLGSEVQSGLITALSFRQDETYGLGASTCTWTGATVMLSSTTAAPDALSDTFANNLGADATVVAQGDIVITTVESTASPRPFAIRIELSTPFFFDASTGLNLLLDITLPVHEASVPCFNHPVLDSQSQGWDCVSTVLCSQGGCTPAMDTASIALTMGMITLFDKEILFGNGFESGDTTGWSSAVGGTS